MRGKILRVIAGTICLVAWMPAQLLAINISVQYPAGTLFHSGADGTAKAAINAAAADISDAITSSLNAVTTDTYTGTSGGTSATYDWNYRYTNPSTGQNAVIENATTPADTVVLYVGTRSLGSDDLGVGGPGVVGFNINLSAVDQAQLAIDAAGNLSEQALLRGGGPVNGTIAGSLDFGSGYVFDSSVSYGITTGSLSFDIDEDNNGSWDNASSLDDYWHWNHNTSVGSGKNDLYSVAVHEMLHALGVGVSESWNSLKSGTTWNGSEVQAITGSGAGLIQAAGGHITSNVMSTRISDGMQQEVVMDPSLTKGQRKELTVLDLAFLRDIGYETIAPTVVYDTADYDTDGDVDAADLATLENWYGVTAQGDADGDGDTDGSDLLVWQRQHTGAIGSLAVGVPEPTVLTLTWVATMLAVVVRQRRS